jgi:CRISPR-associated protein Csm3
VKDHKPILGKIILSGTLTCRTGLHIGGSDTELSIGGIDKTVVRDPLTQQPYIPGSSLKGKLRCLLERVTDKPFNRQGGTEIYRHECTDPDCEVCRLFGATRGQDAKASNLPSRLLVRDAFLTPRSVEELDRLETGLPFTEWKSENGLDRITCAANPRQMERVPAGAVFGFDLVYTAEEPSHLEDDLARVMMLLRLLEDDALGGGGSRGNGSVGIRLDRCRVRPRSFYLRGDGEIGLDVSDRDALPGLAASSLREG